MRVVLLLIASSVHGASVSNVGHTALATWADENASAIGTRNSVRRTRFDMRCGCRIAPSTVIAPSPFPPGTDHLLTPRPRSGRRVPSSPAVPCARA